MVLLPENIYFSNIFEITFFIQDAFSLLYQFWKAMLYLLRTHFYFKRNDGPVSVVRQSLILNKPHPKAICTSLVKWAFKNKKILVSVFQILKSLQSETNRILFRLATRSWLASSSRTLWVFNEIGRNTSPWWLRDHWVMHFVQILLRICGLFFLWEARFPRKPYQRCAIVTERIFRSFQWEQNADFYET